VDHIIVMSHWSYDTLLSLQDIFDEKHVHVPKTFDVEWENNVDNINACSKITFENRFSKPARLGYVYCCTWNLF
jgi:hypothetical protein